MLMRCEWRCCFIHREARAPACAAVLVLGFAVVANVFRDLGRVAKRRRRECDKTAHKMCWSGKNNTTKAGSEQATSERECERDSVVGVRASKEAGPTDRATDRCYIATAVALGILVQALCMHYVFVYNVRYIYVMFVR